MNFAAMPASPEMDELIAGRLFGWRWWRFQPYSWGDRDYPIHATWHGPPDNPIVTPPHRFFHPSVVWAEPPYSMHPGWEPILWDGVEELAISPWGSLPPYSTDIAAAWQIVAKLHAQDMAGVIITDCCGKPPWTVTFGDVSANAQTVMLAICRAALLAPMASSPRPASDCCPSRSQ